MRSKIIGLGLSLFSLCFLFKFGEERHQIAIAGFTALILVLWSLYQGELRLKNKIVLALLAYIPFATWFALKPQKAVAGVALPTWSWLPMAMILVYALMYASIKKEDIKALPWIVWIGFIASVYCIMQYFGIDTPIVPTTRLDNCLVPSSLVVAWFGHPTYAGCSIAMLVPLVIKIAMENEKYWIMLLFFVLAVLFTKSDMAIGSMLVSLFVLLFLHDQKRRLIYVFIAIACSSLLVINRDKINDNGRFTVWQQTMQDIFEPVKFDKYEKRYSLTGRGIGSYKYFFHMKHPSGQTYETLKTHNEYLQIWFEMGFVAFVLVLIILFYHILMVKDVYIKTALICICINACGLYVWQLGFTQFMTIYLLGLSKKELNKRGINEG